MSAIERHDAIVVGGGPAGSACAAGLVRAGLQVLVLDRAEFPRDKPCAGWVTPGVLEALGLTAATYAATGRTIQPLTAMRAGAVGGPETQVEFGEVVSWGTRRCELDHYLLLRSGASVRSPLSVQRLRRDGDEWVVEEAYRAPLLVGAGGHFCPVGRLLNQRCPPAQLVAAQELEFRMDARQRAACRVDPEVPEIHFCRDLRGYGWCFRKGDHLNVGLGRRDPRRLTGHLRDYVHWQADRGRIPADLPRAWRGHAYRLYEAPARRLLDDGVLLVGDAAGLAAPASGEGIRPAVESGLLAARAILAAHAGYRREDLLPYELALRRRFGRRAGRRELPSALSRWLAGRLFGWRWFVHRVVLERWFLQRHRETLGGAPALPEAAGLGRAS